MLKKILHYRSELMLILLSFGSFLVGGMLTYCAYSNNWIHSFDSLPQFIKDIYDVKTIFLKELFSSFSIVLLVFAFRFLSVSFNLLNKKNSRILFYIIKVFVKGPYYFVLIFSSAFLGFTIVVAYLFGNCYLILGPIVMLILNSVYEKSKLNIYDLTECDRGSSYKHLQLAIVCVTLSIFINIVIFVCDAFSKYDLFVKAINYFNT